MRLIAALLTMLCCAVAHGQALSLADPSKPSQASSVQGPADVSGLVLWYKPESLSGANGTAIETWTDSSSNGWDMTNSVAGKQPYITNSVANGYAAAYFDGGDVLLAEGGALNSWSSVSGATLIAVTRTNGASANQGVLFVGRNAAGSARAYLWNSSSRPALGGRRLDTDSFQQVVGSSSITSGWVIREAWIDYSNSDATVFTNGVSAASSTTFQTDGTTSATASVAICMGAISDAPSEPLTGWIAEAIFYNRAISSADRTIIMNYLSAKFGL